MKRRQHNYVLDVYLFYLKDNYETSFASHVITKSCTLPDIRRVRKKLYLVFFNATVYDMLGIAGILVYVKAG